MKSDSNEPWWLDPDHQWTPECVRLLAVKFERRGVDPTMVSILRRVALAWHEDNETQRY